MINELNETIANGFGLDFDKLLDNFVDYSYSRHRLGYTYYSQGIVEINEKRYPEVDSQLYGFWETNEFIFNKDDDGFDKSDITTLTRVIQKEKIVVQKYWAKA